MTLRC